MSNALRKEDIPGDDLEFYNRISPVLNGVSYPVPAPKEDNFDLRKQHRLAFRNQRILYRRTCDFSGQEILSNYSPKKHFPVYGRKVWWTEACKPISYGREFDFGSPFFEQFAKLQRVVPMPSLIINNCENSEFNNNIDNSRNCYLSFGVEECFDSLYITDSFNLRDCLDAWGVKNSENCYHTYRGGKLFNCKYTERCSGSSDLLFCRMCTDCHHCFGCMLINHKQYCIFNKQYTKEQYFEFIDSLNLGSHKEVQDQYLAAQNFFATCPMSPNGREFVEECTWGDLVYHAKNCHACFTIDHAEDCKYMFEVSNAQRSQDIDCCNDVMGLSYQVVASKNFFNLFFSYNCRSSSDSYYLMDCTQVKHCFGCVGLYNKEYCILNKQFSKEDYFELLPKIISHLQETGEWGEFFPTELSRFGYNETDARLYYPLRRDIAIREGFRWNDYRNEPEIESLLAPEVIPDHISDVSDDICKQTLMCEVSGRVYKITSKELSYYRSHDIPIPRRHPEQRFRDFLAIRNPMWMNKRQCHAVYRKDGKEVRCQEMIDSAWPLDSPQKVFCTPCYYKWIYT